MKVLINATGARGGGGETFLLGLIPELVKAAPSSYFTIVVPESRIHLYGHHSNLLIVPVSQQIIKNSIHRFCHEHGKMVSFLRRGVFDVFFQADEMLSPLATFLKIPTLAVVHATQHMLIPKLIGDSPAKLFYLNTIKSLAMKRASVIVTVSHHAKGELSGLYPKARDRIRVIYHGIDHAVFRPLAHQPKPLYHMGIDRYILSVSDRHIHKNYFKLIQAFALLCRNNTVTEHLVLVGRPKVADEEKRINELIESERLQNRVHLLEYAAQEQLAEIYRGASAYVFPSTFETFGFTPLEAMACGVPVACAWCSAMPEVCGDAVEYFDPADISDMVRAIEVVLFNTNRRMELVQMGKRHGAKFTWRRAAEKYYRVLAEIGKKV